MLHNEATTCLVLPTGLSREIQVTFSFRQGDPIAMNLYILQQEPLLRMLRATLTGLTITNFKQLDKSYCDDIENLSGDIRDLAKFDEVMVKFEMTSGAILSRTIEVKSDGHRTMEGKTKLARGSEVDESGNGNEDLWVHNLPNLSTNPEKDLGQSFARI